MTTEWKQLEPREVGVNAGWGKQPWSYDIELSMHFRGFGDKQTEWTEWTET